MRWIFDPSQERLGLPPGRVQELHVIYVAGATLTDISRLEPPSDGPRVQTVWIDIASAAGVEDSARSGMPRMQIAHLVLLRFIARLASGDAPDKLVHQGTYGFHELALRHLLGEEVLRAREVCLKGGGKVRICTYPVPPGAERSFLLIRDGGPIPS